MILAGQWEPTPPRAGSLDDCMARGFDTDSIRHDHATPEPLDDVWQAALDGAVEAAKHRAESDDDDHCGERCDRCQDRMCSLDGPEPRACGTTCADCPCDCTACLLVREDMRADLLHRLEREAN